MRIIFYLMCLLPFVIFAQQGRREVSGEVLDLETKEPIIGASVYISLQAVESERSVIGTITDIEGKFAFEIPESAKNLIISYTGYETQTLKIELQKLADLSIALRESSQVLDEVVLTGYQETTMRKTTSAIAKVEAKDIRQVGVSNVDQMLVGQLAGVSVQTTTGAPGAPVKINIRGSSTLNGSTDPLWVLDGVPLEGNDIPQDFRDKDNIDQLRSYPIAGINPSDIESITVLKDASATSIYGARAANGVIVITTKSGQKGSQRINITASTFVTQRPDYSKLNLMNSDQKVDFELFLAGRSDLNYQSQRGAVARTLEAYGEYDNYAENGFSNINPEAQAAINALRQTNTKWGDELYQMAINQQYGISISGGNDRGNYYFSGGYFDEKGTTIGTGQKRFNLTLKNSYNLTDQFKVGVALFGSQNRTFSYLSGTDAYTNPAYYARMANPYLRLKDANGDYVYDPDLVERSDLNLDYNALEERQNTSNELISNSLKSIFNAKYSFGFGLVVNSQLGLQIDNDRGEKIAKEDSYYTRKYEQRSQFINSAGERDYYMPKGGIIQNTNGNDFQYNWKSTLNYGQVFYDRHEFDVLLGTEFRKTTNESISTKGFGYNANTLTTVPITNERALENSNFDTYRKTFVKNTYASFFGTFSYTYNQKYSVFSSLRFDGSNLFGVNPKYRYLPIWSVAGSWNLANESFLFHSSLDILKLRASYGIQGNIDKSTSPYVIGTYATQSLLPGIQEEAIRANGAPNGNLRWEKTSSTNVGFDLGLWNNRVFISNDYYYRKSSDLIGLRAVPLESGYSYINTNWASVTNKGVELMIRTKNIDLENFTWTTNVNVAANRSEVIDIQVNEDSFTPSLKGHSVNSVFAIKTAGLDGNGLPLFEKDGQVMSAVDFFKLNESTDGGQLTREEHRALYTYVGSSAPKFIGGINNAVRYKQFDLQVAANFNVGQTVKRTPSYQMTNVQPGSNYSTEVLSAGSNGLPALIGANSSGIGVGQVYRWFSNGDDGNSYNDLDIWVKKMSYLRINSIRLGYTLPTYVVERMHMGSARVYLEGRNLLVISTDYTYYFDPETYGSPYAQPISRMVSAGLSLSF